jgi:hypothetical protein
LAAAGALAIVMAGCTGTTVVKDYGPDAKRNFVDGCTTNRSVRDGKVIETKLAPKSTCECVYDTIDKVYRLDFGDLTDYEAKVDAYKAGNPEPKMPDKLRKAIDKCTTSGPAVPTTTTTSVKPK